MVKVKQHFLMPVYFARSSLQHLFVKVLALVRRRFDPNEPNPHISHKHKFIYYPVPKAGCTTIKTWMLEEEGINMERKMGIHSLKIPQISIHWVLESEYRDYFHFAFVRNPWDRLVSCYYDKIYDARNKKNEVFVDGEYRGFTRKYGKGYFADMSFADFVRFVATIPEHRCDVHFKPQHLFLNMEALDFIGRFEDFRLDFRYVMEEIGATDHAINFLVQKRMRSSFSGDYRKLYDEETKEIVARKYARDIELFNYTF